MCIFIITALHLHDQPNQDFTYMVSFKIKAFPNVEKKIWFSWSHPDFLCFNQKSLKFIYIYKHAEINFKNYLQNNYI